MTALRERRLPTLGHVAAVVLLFAVLATCYLASIGLRASRGASITGDEPFYLVTTQSLLQDGDLDLRQQYASESYRSFFDHAEPLWRQADPLPDGRLLSPHQPGLSVLLIPGFALGGLLGAQIQMLLIAAATFALAYHLIARETGRRLARLGRDPGGRALRAGVRLRHRDSIRRCPRRCASSLRWCCCARSPAWAEASRWSASCPRWRGWG